MYTTSAQSPHHDPFIPSPPKFLIPAPQARATARDAASLTMYNRIRDARIKAARERRSDARTDTAQQSLPSVAPSGSTSVSTDIEPVSQDFKGFHLPATQTSAQASTPATPSQPVSQDFKGLHLPATQTSAQASTPATPSQPVSQDFKGLHLPATQTSAQASTPATPSQQPTGSSTTEGQRVTGLFPEGYKGPFRNSSSFGFDMNGAPQLSEDSSGDTKMSGT